MKLTIFPLPFRQSALVWLPLALCGLILDQITKYIALETLQRGYNVEILPGFNFALVFNYGAAFGFLNQGAGWQVVLLIAIAIIATLVFTLWLARIPKQDYVEGCGIVLMLSGAIGNLLDRFQHGYVVDFLDVYIATWHWPAFNLADSFICVGAAMLMLVMWRK